MTKGKHLKRRIRERSAKTGERYTSARRHLLPPTQERSNMTTVSRTFSAACSFCKKSTEQVSKLIAGPGVYICDECIGLCTNILGEEARRDSAAAPDAPKPSLDDRPIEQLLAIFTGMVETARSMTTGIDEWAVGLHGRGVSVGRIAAAAGLSEDDARERFKM